MSILTEKRVWKRGDGSVSARRLARRLTPEQATAVRQVMHQMVLSYGSRAKLAAALGYTITSMEKAIAPSRATSLNLVFAIARVAGVGVDDVLEGRWKRHVCPRCGHIGAHAEIGS